MPCLDEHETVGACVQKAVGALTQSGLTGEVIVADNGSTDGSVEIAESLGARVVGVQERGYGHTVCGIGSWGFGEGGVRVWQITSSGRRPPRAVTAAAAC